MALSEDRKYEIVEKLTDLLRGLSQEEISEVVMIARMIINMPIPAASVIISANFIPGFVSGLASDEKLLGSILESYREFEREVAQKNLQETKKPSPEKYRFRNTKRSIKPLSSKKSSQWIRRYMLHK